MKIIPITQADVGAIIIALQYQHPVNLMYAGRKEQTEDYVFGKSNVEKLRKWKSDNWSPLAILYGHHQNPTTPKPKISEKAQYTDHLMPGDLVQVMKVDTDGDLQYVSHNAIEHVNVMGLYVDEIGESTKYAYASKLISQWSWESEVTRNKIIGLAHGAVVTHFSTYSGFKLEDVYQLRHPGVSSKINLPVLLVHRSKKKSVYIVPIVDRDTIKYQYGKLANWEVDPYVGPKAANDIDRNDATHRLVDQSLKQASIAQLGN